MREYRILHCFKLYIGLPDSSLALFELSRLVIDQIVINSRIVSSRILAIPSQKSKSELSSNLEKCNLYCYHY